MWVSSTNVPIFSSTPAMQYQNDKSGRTSAAHSVKDAHPQPIRPGPNAQKSNNGNVTPKRAPKAGRRNSLVSPRQLTWPSSLAFLPGPRIHGSKYSLSTPQHGQSIPRAPPGARAPPGVTFTRLSLSIEAYSAAHSPPPRELEKASIKTENQP